MAELTLWGANTWWGFHCRAHTGQVLTPHQLYYETWWHQSKFLKSLDGFICKWF